MQIAKGRQNAPLATALLFVSLAITPLSLRAVGISLNFGAGVEALRHIAGLLGDGRQPVGASDILARNLGGSDVAPVDATPATDFLLAWARMAAPAVESEAAAVDNSLVTAGAAHRCVKGASHGGRGATRVEAPRLASALPSLLPAATPVPAVIEGSEAAWVASGVAIKVPAPARSGCDRALRTYQQEVERHRADIEHAMRFVPQGVRQGLRMMVRLQSKASPGSPAVDPNEFRRVFSLEKLKQLRVAEARPLSFDFVVASPENSDNSEL